MITKKEFHAIPLGLPSSYVGAQWVYKFDNGYALSVILRPHSYGFESGAFEIAVLKNFGDSTLLAIGPDDNPWWEQWGDDVYGCLDFDEVGAWIHKTENLPSREQ